MLDLFNNIFGPGDGENGDDASGNENHDVRIAVCALFLEMATIDGEFDKDEWDSIINSLINEFDVSEEIAVQLTEEAAKEANESLDIWKFTNRINQNYSVDEKIKVVEMLWRIVYADGKVDKHEDYLIRQCASLLNLKHSQLIAAKLAAKREEE